MRISPGKFPESSHWLEGGAIIALRGTPTTLKTNAPMAPTFTLIIDDEVEFARLQQLLLESTGCPAGFATSIKEGLQYGILLAARDAVAIVDMMMPEVDGVSTIRILQQTYPDLKFVASSGHAESRFRPHLDKVGVKKFLPKPYTIEQLHEALDEVLAVAKTMPEPAALPEAVEA
jgi:CheY-like chemotaxis protein